MEMFSYTDVHMRLESPEDSLRLVTLYSDGDDKIVRCAISSLPSSSPYLHPYRALSYTWGDHSRKVPISLNGKRFLVTANLDDALRHLRRALPQGNLDMDLNLGLWIDAICINQEDSEERDSQVRRMRSIYHQAREVIIWLGKYNEPTDGTFQIDLKRWMVDEVKDNSETMARSALVLAQFLKEEAGRKGGSEVSIRLDDFTHVNDVQVWVQLSRLFYRPWFERLWIIQELAVSRHAMVLWGKHQLAWSTVEAAAKFILRPGDAELSPYIRKLFPLLGAHRITQVALQSMLNIDTKNILTVLHNTQNAKCSDPRDRLFAILGVIDDTEDVDIDYSIPATEVYIRWAQKRIKRLDTLDILNACADSGREGDLPSWVPDLRRPFGQDRLLWNYSQTAKNAWDNTLSRLAQPVEQEPNQASENRKRSQKRSHNTQAAKRFKFQGWRLSQDGLNLTVDGQYLGDIHTLTEVADAVTDLEDPTNLTARLWDIVDSWKALCSQLRPQAGYREALLRDFGAIGPETRELVKAYEYWYAKQNTSEKGLRDPLSNMNRIDQEKLNQEASMRDFERLLFPRVHKCQMFTMRGNREGTHVGVVAGNCGVRTGDELWRLSGGMTPFILRGLSAAPEAKHRLISPCYLSGHMSPFANYIERDVTLI